MLDTVRRVVWCYEVKKVVLKEENVLQLVVCFCQFYGEQNDNSNHGIYI